MSSQASASATQREEPTGWTGWIRFAAVLLILAGCLNALYGLVALFDTNLVIWDSDRVLFVNLTTWAWAHIVLGMLVALCGVGLLSGNLVARAVAALLAAISLAVNFFFIPVYPLWSLVIITLDVLVLWAVLVHGRELKGH